MKRNYVLFDVRTGYPTGDDLYYECGICGDALPSLPKDGLGCTCGNIFIDVDAGKVAVKDHSKIRAFSNHDDPIGRAH